MHWVMPTRGYYRGNYYSVLLFRLLIALLFFWLSRILFLVLNRNYFVTLTSEEIYHILFSGLRYDLSSLFTINLPFIVLMTFPWPLRRKKWYQRFTALWYYIPNLTAIALNIIDIVFFRFTRNRMSADIIHVINAGMPMKELISQVLVDFWPYVLGYIVIVLIFIRLTGRVNLNFRRFVEKRFSYYLLQIFSFLITTAISIVFIRGGVQLKPVQIISAGQYVKPEHFPLILNTPFTILKTIGEQHIERLNYFDQDTAESIWTPVHQYAPESFSLTLKHQSRPLNVVLLIVESLATEHIGALNTHIEGYEGFTPFLDSLISHSLVFRGYANAKTSINGIPAVVASIPALTERSFIVSRYAGNRINSLASLLSEKGYRCLFFHGGTNGTLNLDHFSSTAGFHQYFGRKEYGNDQDYDGQWGIFDEPFLYFVADQLNQTPEPFCSVIFTLSSHHPYRIPSHLIGKFRKGNLEIQQAIMYADYALSRFFNKISTTDWFHRTLFIITADHASDTYLPEYKTKAGIYRIPIIFYLPGQKIPYHPSTIAAQTDILPSVMALLGYDKPFIAFGNNLFDPQLESFAVQYMNGIYQIIKGDYLLEFDGHQSLSLYNLEDGLCTENVLKQNPDKALELENMLKAYLQHYTNRLIDNQLVIR